MEAGAGKGECHRHAPMPQPRADSGTLNPAAWPVTAARDYCGDWRRQTKRTQRPPKPRVVQVRGPRRDAS